MYKDYDAEQVMLREDLRKKREAQLFSKEKELRDQQRNRFGFEGDLFKKRQELIKPVQDKVYNAVQKIATTRGYDFILDKSEGITVIFADPKLDKSDDIVSLMPEASKIDTLLQRYQNDSLNQTLNNIVQEYQYKDSMLTKVDTTKTPKQVLQQLHTDVN